MNANNGPENCIDSPSEPLRPSRKHQLENLPWSGSRLKPRQANGAEVVNNHADEGDVVESLLHGVLCDVNVAEAEGLAGGLVHGDDAGARLGPGRQGRGEGNAVGAVAGLDGHALEVEVLDCGRGCSSARGEAIVVAEIMGEFAGVLRVHVRDDAGFHLCFGGGAAIGSHCGFFYCL